MNVLYDHQIFTTQIYGGISRYFFELISILSKDATASVKLPVVHTNNRYLKDSDLIRFNKLLNGKRFFGRTTLVKYYTEFLTKKCLQSKKYDIFHPTYYDPYFLKYVGDLPFVITVHDMIHELFPDNFTGADKTAEWKKATVEKAAGIIAISENTKQDLMRLYGVDESKIAIIHHASSLAPLDACPAFPLPTRYLLFVGSRKGYKNFRLFIEGVSPLIRRESDLYVVCAGGPAFSPEETEAFERLSIAERVLQCQVDDRVLATLYHKAVAFVFPSRYEGFGIPILEAFNCRCPALLSNTSSLPEVGGDAALYFDPTDALSIRAAVEEVLQDHELRRKLIQKGSERAKEFSWERTAQQTKALYRKVSGAS